MAPNYQTELVQIAAAALAAAQVDEVGTTRLDVSTREGERGLWSMERFLNEVRHERAAQELKWGTRHERDARPTFWLTVLLEEIGEVAEEIAKTAPQPMLGIVNDAIMLGNNARLILEQR